MTVKGLLRLLLLWMTVSSLSSAKLDEYQILAYRIKPAVIRVVAVVVVEYTYIDQNNVSRSGNTALGGTGSGFILNPEGYIATNGQVIGRVYRYENNSGTFANEVSPYVILQIMRREGLKQITPESRSNWALNRRFTIVNSKTFKKVVLSNGEMIDFDIRRYSRTTNRGGKDVGILKIERGNLPSVNLGDSAKVELQEEVQVFGYPGAADVDGIMGFYLNPKSSLQVTINVGRVSSEKQDYRGVPLIQTNALVGPGSSGGPAVNRSGEVVGVTTFAGGEADEFGEFRQVQGINFLIPIDSVKDLMLDVGVDPNKGSAFNDIYFKALGHVRNEEWYEAGREVDSVLNLFGDSPALRELKQKITFEIQSLPWWRKMWKENKLAFILGVFIIGLVILFLYLILESRRKPSIPVAPGKRAEPAGEKQDPGAVATRDAHQTEEKTIRLHGSIDIFVDEQKMGRYPVTDTPMTIGRDPGKSGVIIQDPIVSKLHCSILVQNDVALIQDNNSTNGTYFGDQKIVEKVLENNDVILLGKRGTIKMIFHK